MIASADNGFIVKSSGLFLITGIGAALVECVGLYFFMPMLMEFDGSLGDFGATAFICLWLGVVLFGALMSFYRYSKKAIIDDDGISYRSIFGKQHLDWHEIQDYGMSYNGRSNVGGNYKNSYIVYFAKETQENKNRYKKKLSKNAVKIYIIGDDYAYFSEYVVPFCMSKTDVQPFVPSDDLHFF